MALITSRPQSKTTVDGLPLAYQLFTEGNYVPMMVEVERTTITDDLTNSVVVFSASGGKGNEYYISKSSEYPSQVSLISISNDRIKALVKLVKEDTLFFLDDVTSFQYSVGLRTDLGLMELERGFFNVNPSLALGKLSQSSVPDLPPVIELIAPVGTEQLSVNKSFKLLAKASDVGGAIEKVDFYANDIKIGTNPSYSTKGVWDFKYTPTQAGSVTFYAIATDSSANATKSNAIAVSVQAEVVVPTANFSFTPLTGAAPLSVTFVNTSVNAATYSWSFGDNTALSTAIAPTHIYQTSGNYTITLTAANQYGSSAISKNVTVSLAANQAPSVSITNPANNSSVTVGQQLALTATASDSDGSITSVQFRVNGVNHGVALTNSPYITSFTPSSAGTYTITAIATDNFGLTATSNAVSITAETSANQAPTVNITSPANNAVLTTDEAVTITATATDPDGTISSVQFKVNDVNLNAPVTSPPYSTSWTPTVSDSYTITAVATDNLGLTATSNAVSVTTETANQAPTISITSPANNAVLTTDEAVTITATATDPDGTISSVQFKVNDVNLNAPVTSPPYSTSWTPTVSDSYTITAVATDNLAATTTSPVVTVTSSAPTIPTPTVNIATTTPQATLINTSISVVADAAITDDTLASVQFRVDGTNIGSPDTSSPYSADYTPTTKGIKQLSAVATGSQGGTQTSTNYAVTAFDLKLIGGDAGGGCSLGAIPEDYILFDNNQAVGGNAASMDLFVDGVQVAAFNYADTAYNGMPFAYFNSANATLYTGTITAGTVNL